MNAQLKPDKEEFYVVPCLEVDQYFDPVAMQTVIDYTGGEEYVEDVYAALKNGSRAMVILYVDGIRALDITFQVVQYPRMKALRIITISGHDYITLSESVDNYAVNIAKDLGLGRVEWLGRLGHKKITQKYGYEPRYLMMTKDIQE